MPRQLAGLISPDSMQATPRKNKLLGLLADAVGSVDRFARKPFGYENPPVGLLSDAIGVPSLQRTLDRMSYGEPLTTGKGQATQLRPDTVDAMGFIPASPKTAMSMAGGLMGHAPAIDHAAIVWHGSPHKFDAFDASKIGTGEGAQAYGHGLYLAESPETAAFYKEKLTSDGTFGGYKSANEARARILNKHSDRVQATDPERAARLRADADAIIPGGALYKVDIPDDAIARMLDWDKPLSQQPESIRKEFAKIGADEGMTGQQAYRAAHESAIRSGKALPAAQKERQAVESLRKAGIPGIRYLDGGSRADGIGTSNFVVFPGNEGLLTILERNGQPVEKVAK